MKAFLLAAGTGSRLAPLTDTVPKCLVPVAGRPMLDIWLDALAAAGVDEVLVNVHHLAAKVRSHIQERTSPPTVLVEHEPELLGSAGTLIAHRQWVATEDLFLVCYADNLTDFDLERLIDFHRESAEVASVAVFRAQRPSECGIVEVDASNRIVGFVEKAAEPVGDLANAGIYAFAPAALDGLEGPGPLDIGYHLLPRLVGRARALEVGGYFRDIGTPESYERAQLDWRAGARS